jgi:hypothetical protein
MKGARLVKSMEDTVLLNILKDLVTLAKKKNNSIDYKEINEALSDIDIDPKKSASILSFKILTSSAAVSKSRRISTKTSTSAFPML